MSAVVAGFNQNNRAKCRTCRLPYARPAEVYFWQYWQNKNGSEDMQHKGNNDKDKGRVNNINNTAANNNSDNATAKKLKEMEQENKELRKKVQQWNKDNDGKQHDKFDDTATDSTAYTEQKINKQVEFIANTKENRPDDKELLDKLERELDEMRTKRLQAKPLSTRQLNVTRRLDKARNHRQTAQEAQKAEHKRHAEASAKIKEDLDKTDATIKQLEEESKNLLKEAAGNTPAATPANFIDSVMDKISEQIPNNMSILPEGMAFVEQFKGALTLFASTLEKAKHDLDQQQRQQAAEAEKAAQHAARALEPLHDPAPSSADNIDADHDFVMDDAQVDAFIRDIVGEHNQEEESEEQWQTKVQRQKANFSKAGIAKLKTLKTKASKK